MIGNTIRFVMLGLVATLLGAAGGSFAFGKWAARAPAAHGKGKPAYLTTVGEMPGGMRHKVRR